MAPPHPAASLRGLNICTIIAKNYVGYARVLAHSLAENQPGSRLWTLVIDDFARYIDPAQEPFEVLTPAEVGCEPFERMALRYSVLELSTAVKPWLMRHLMRTTGGPVTYLDPDIRLFGPLERLDQLAAQHGVVLTPHNTTPIPSDGRKPSQVDIMIAGIYNLGYLSLAPKPEVDHLLDWWSDRLLRDCRVDPVWGYFVDQRWFDLAPGFLTDFSIVRDAEYNVAYWNLHDRPLQHDRGRYLVNDRPLAFFHFSGFDPEQPLVLSRHQDRVDVTEHPVLERLLAEYATAVLAEGHAVARHWPYSYGALGDGTPVTDTFRRLYDDFADQHDGAVDSPFTLEGLSVFERWMAEQEPGVAPGINRVLARVYDDRPDLRAAYPDLIGADAAGLRRWAEGIGVQEEPLLERAMSSDEISASGSRSKRRAPTTPLRQAPWGINVIADFRSASRMGQVARQLVAAMDAIGLPVLPISSQQTMPAGEPSAFATAAPADASFNVNLICLDVQDLPDFAKHAGVEFFAGRYSAGLWFWDAGRLPERLRDHASLLEEVVVPTAYVAGALEALGSTPVSQIRIPVSPEPLEPGFGMDFGLPEERFLFHFGFDYLDGHERNNPMGVIAAFRREFTPDEAVGLVLRCGNPGRAPLPHAELCGAAGEHPGIIVIDRDLSEPETKSLIVRCDSYVSLHRAEAFGLSLADAMWFAKPVIATGYSGNLDFMTAENSHLVDHRLVPIDPVDQPDHAAGMWAAPDLDHAAKLMRQVVSDREAAGQLGAVASRDIRRTHAPQIAGQMFLRRVDAIRATGRARRAVDPRRGRPSAIAKLPLSIRRGPNPPTSATQAGARDIARKVILRTMRPFTAYQQSVNRDVVSGLGDLSDAITGAGQQTAVERALRMAQARGAERSLSLFEARVVDQLRRPIEDATREVAEVKTILTLQSDRNLYLALAELQRRDGQIAAEAAEHQTALDLTRSELRAFSQNGEDGVLAEILRRIGTRNRYFVEFGVGAGREGNCVYLADVAAWQGSFMEADGELHHQLERKYLAQGAVNTICARVSGDNVEQLLIELNVPAEPDVISIDIDGQDYWIWEAIENYRPRVLVIEYNSSLDPRRSLVQPKDPTACWDGTDYFGASIGALQAMARRKDYRLVHTDLSGVNAFFVRSDLAGEAFLPAGDVAIRGVPNYFQTGYHHPPAAPGRRYLDLDTGELVEVSTERR